MDAPSLRLAEIEKETPCNLSPFDDPSSAFVRRLKIDASYKLGYECIFVRIAHRELSQKLCFTYTDIASDLGISTQAAGNLVKRYIEWGWLEARSITTNGRGF